jgi:hypothetical protein
VGRTPQEALPASVERPVRHWQSFALYTDSVLGEQVLACQYRSAQREGMAGPKRQFYLELARSNNHARLRAIAQRLAIEYGVPLREIPAPQP